MFTAATVPTPVVSSSVMFRCIRIASVVLESFIQTNSEFAKSRKQQKQYTQKTKERLD